MTADSPADSPAAALAALAPFARIAALIAAEGPPLSDPARVILAIGGSKGGPPLTLSAADFARAAQIHAALAQVPK